MNNSELCKKIKAEMEKQNINQSDIAKVLNVRLAGHQPYIKKFRKWQKHNYK